MRPASLSGGKYEMAESEPSEGFDADEIKALIQKSKTQKKEYPFAFGLASKPEDCGLLVHLRKPSKTLKTELKRSSKKVTKVCFGTFTVVGPEVLLKPVRPLKGIVKQLKKRFRDAGMTKYKPVLVDASGKVLDEDTLPDADRYNDDDTEDTGGEDSISTEADQTSDLKELVSRLNALATNVSGLPKDVSVKLMPVFKAAKQQIDEGDLVKADSSITKLETAIAKVADAPGKTNSNQVASVKEAMVKTAGRVQALTDSAWKKKLGTELKAVQKTLKDGDLKGAASALAAVQTGLAQAQASKIQGAADPMVIWRDAKEKVDVSFAPLKNTLKGLGHPDLDRIAEFGLNGVTDGNQTALNRALFEYNGSEGPARQKAASRLSDQVSEYRKFIDSNAIIELCEDNPFGVRLDIRGPLRDALDKIERAIA